ncbi:MAG: acetyl-CoA carboxylase, biotin carboxyl carrier protein, partial [Hyphomicrobiaceae bacterium]|nr:acetyl-CoA carboxylase, biotin carboxyl carrier protein [Hyphomicrobiaceae bacterium]
MARDSKDKSNADEQQLIRELAMLLDETGLTEIEIEKSGLKVRVARSVSISAAAPSAIAASVPAAAPARAIAADEGDPANHPGAVKSPMVGTAYRAPEPGAAVFVEIGARVSEGQTL